MNIHTLPIFTSKIAFGKKGFPWSSPFYKGKVNYGEGTCPIAEKLHNECLINIPICMYDWESKDILIIGEAFDKVWPHVLKV